MHDELEKAHLAAAAIRDHWPTVPRVGIILGSGLGDLSRQVEVAIRLPFEAIPHFPRATALGHRGQWIGGQLAGLPVAAMEGRFHLYEGYSAAQVALPVRVMAALGVELLILSNACGGLHPNGRGGDILVIEDHVNLTFANPLVGPLEPGAAIAYPDMSAPYDRQLIERALAIARREGFAARAGTYVGVVGPNYETRAEYRWLRRLGDVVGMSTVCEAIVAAQCQLRVLGLAVVTNVCQPDRLEPTTPEHVISIAAAAEPRVRAIIQGIIQDAVPRRLK
jgi:purine-nucleoside phosphorylase